MVPGKELVGNNGVFLAHLNSWIPMKKTTRLKLEELESRLTPSTTGVTWPDAAHLTLSFAPDGTDVGGAPSGLFRLLNTQGTPAAWEHEILRAVQTWASAANINVSVMGDGGQPFGSGGAVEGDTRFGDIRVGAKPLPAGTIATCTPFDWTGTTWAGDIVFNSNYSFGLSGNGMYDLYTVVLHESGHAFGELDTTTDPSSAMYAAYLGVRSGLGAGDLTDIHSLYGSRTPDAFDQKSSNDTIARASTIGSLIAFPTVDADITTPADVDYYKFTSLLSIPAGVTGFSITVQTSQISSLVPSLTVYDLFKHVIGSTVATDPTNGNLTVKVNQFLPGLTYYVRVGANASDVFGIGGYRLSVNWVTSGLGQVLTPVYTFLTDNHTNDLIGSATGLNLNWGAMNDARFQYLYWGNIGDASDVDYYQVRAPETAGNVPQVLSGLVWSMDPTHPLQPRLSVFDGSGQPVPVTVLANGNGSYTIQITNAASQGNYYLRVLALNPSSNNIGNYCLGLNFHSQPGVTLQDLAGGTLSGANAVTDTFTANESQLFNFVLSSATHNGSTQAAVQLSLVNATGQAVLILTAQNGQSPVTAVVYLAAGTYSIRYQALSLDGSPAPLVDYWLAGEALSDALGAYSTSTGNNNQGGGSSYNYGSSSASAPPPSRPYYY